MRENISESHGITQKESTETHTNLRNRPLGGGEISHKMRTRSSWFLGRDAEDRVRVMESVAEFYRVRSEIVHKGKRKASAERYRESFDTGFDLAARTLFKLLKEGPPSNWEKLVIAGK